MSRFAPDIGETGVIEGIFRGDQGSHPEKHLHLLEVAPEEGEKVNHVRKGQEVGLIVILALLAAAEAQGAALRGMLHHQGKQVLLAAEPADAGGGAGAGPA
jgi:hypothetical protein